MELRQRYEVIMVIAMGVDINIPNYKGRLHRIYSDWVEVLKRVPLAEGIL